MSKKYVVGIESGSQKIPCRHEIYYPVSSHRVLKRAVESMCHDRRQGTNAYRHYIITDGTMMDCGCEIDVYVQEEV